MLAEEALKNTRRSKTAMTLDTRASKKAVTLEAEEQIKANWVSANMSPQGCLIMCLLEQRD